MKLKLLLPALLFPITLLAQTAEKNANAFVNTFMQGNYTQALSYADSAFQNKVTPAMLGQIRESIIQKLGDFKKIISTTTKTELGNQACYVYCGFTKDSLDLKTVVNKKLKVIGFFLTQHPKKNHPDNAVNSYNIQSDNLTLPGTLLIPDNNNCKKLVILVHGSGAHDRDETLKMIKPFQDLAEELLKKGIASYRYDKRTYVDPASLPPNYTVDDEVTNDVLNIIGHFHANDSFRNYKLYVVGHSLGALMAPRIALKAGSALSGIVMLAAPARPIEDLLLEQTVYLDSLFPGKETERALQSLRKKVNYLHSPAFNEHSIPDSLPYNQNASYWWSLRAYKPLQTIKKLSQPVFILQGEKDYQVRMTDFNLWKNAAKGMSNISFKSYPGLSHMFMPSEGTPGPKDYLGQKHIPGYVVGDIADWIKTH